MTPTPRTPTTLRREIKIRRPERTDGLAVNRLIARCPPLDTNSVYCNLLQCTHFSATSALADYGGEIAGFVSGYLVPDASERKLFIWQVAVSEQFRGRNIARRLLLDILTRPACDKVRWLETTIGPDNTASRKLFEGIARDLGAQARREVMFESDRDFAGLHESEIKFELGPISPNFLKSTIESEAA